MGKKFFFMVYLENGDIAELTASQVRIERLDGTPVERPVHVSELSAAAVELGEFRLELLIFALERIQIRH